MLALSSQSLALAGEDAIRYVEGVASSEREAHPAPHGWNSFGGCVIDLIEEFAWQTGERFEEWLYEPVKEYSYADLKSFADKYGLGSYDITSNDLWTAWSKNQPNACETFSAHREPLVFGDAQKRLLDRIKQLQSIQEVDDGVQIDSKQRASSNRSRR